MTPPNQASLYDPVRFTHRGRAIRGHVARKSSRSAIVVTGEGAEYRVPWASLRPDEAGERRRVSTRADALKSNFRPGDRIAFRHGARTRRGSVAGIGPKRAHVVCDDGDEFRVPYGMMENESGGAGGSDAARLDAVAAEAESLMERHGLARWSFQFDDASVRAGCCNFRAKVISLSRLFALRAPDDEVRDTVLHEIAHALVGPEHGHDRVWLAAARSIGCSGRRCHEVQFTPPRYIVSCLRCAWNRQVHMRRRRVVCRTCGGPVTYRTHTPKAWAEAEAAAGRLPLEEGFSLR